VGRWAAKEAFQIKIYQERVKTHQSFSSEPKALGKLWGRTQLAAEKETIKV